MWNGHFTGIRRDKFLDNLGRSPKMRASYGLLAQLVEQRTLNPFVAGSIPAQPTNKNKASRDGGLIYFLASRPLVDLFG